MLAENSMKKNNLIQQHKGGLILSCQAWEDDALYSPATMAKVAKAAHMGGAAAIRANSVVDIQAIKQTVNLPIIGIIKEEYPDSEVFITPTKKEIEQLIDVGVEIIAIDATARKRPNNEQLEDLIQLIKESGKYIMADISTYEEGMLAIEYGTDCLSTTLSGYTNYSPQIEAPDYKLIKKLVEYSPVPVFAEGRISTPEQARKLLDLRAHAVVVGSAITRPQIITKRFVDIIKEKEEEDEQKRARKSKY